MKIRLSAFADEAGVMLQDQIDGLLKNNIHMLEIRTVDGVNIADISEEDAKKYAKMLSDAGIKVWSIGSPLGKVDIDGDFDFEEYMKTVHHIYKLAHIFDTKLIRMFSFYKAKNDEDRVVEYLTRMVNDAEKEGLVLCHENEACIFGETAEEIEILLRRVPGLEVVFDFCNFVLARQDMDYAMDALLDKTCYFHLKDAVGATEKIVPAGYGDGLIPEAIARLDRDTVFSLEPHLSVLGGARPFDVKELGAEFAYPTSRDAFDAACAYTRKLLTENGFTETEDGFVR